MSSWSKKPTQHNALLCWIPWVHKMILKKKLRKQSLVRSLQMLPVCLSAVCSLLCWGGLLFCCLSSFRKCSFESTSPLLKAIHIAWNAGGIKEGFLMSSWSKKPTKYILLFNWMIIMEKCVSLLDIPVFRKECHNKKVTSLVLQHLLFFSLMERMGISSCLLYGSPEAKDWARGLSAAVWFIHVGMHYVYV